MISETDIGEYEIIKGGVLGTGAFATVWKGRSKKDSSQVAIKVIKKKNFLKSQQLLSKEITILKELSSLNHRNVVGLLDCVELKDEVCLVMEYCNGGDLADCLHRNGTLSEDTLCSYVKQIAEAMKALQQKGIVHRDLKPQNILLCYEGSKYPHPSQMLLKIADFGFARFISGAEMATTLCGSPMYMAPEVIMSVKYSAKADLWSIGTILYQCLTGRAPFQAQNPQELKRKYEKSPGLKPNIPASTSPELQDLLMRMLKRDAEERISFEEFFKHPFLHLVVPTKAVSQPVAVPKRRMSSSPENATPAKSPGKSSPSRNKKSPSPARTRRVQEVKAEEDMVTTLTEAGVFTKVEKGDLRKPDHSIPEDYVMVPDALSLDSDGEESVCVKKAPLAEEEMASFSVSPQPSPQHGQSQASNSTTISKTKNSDPPGGSSSGQPVTQYMDVGQQLAEHVQGTPGLRSSVSTELKHRVKSPDVLMESAGHDVCAASPGPEARLQCTDLATVGSISPPSVQFCVGTPPNMGSGHSWRRSNVVTPPPTALPGSPHRKSGSPPDNSPDHVPCAVAVAGGLFHSPLNKIPDNIVNMGRQREVLGEIQVMECPHASSSNSSLLALQLHNQIKQGVLMGRAEHRERSSSVSSDKGRFASPDQELSPAFARRSTSTDMSPPHQMLLGPQNSSPLRFIPQPLFEETLMDDNHNETLGKLSFVLDLVECILDLARSLGSAFRSIDPVETRKLEQLTPEHYSRYRTSQRSLEQLVLYARACSLLNSALHLARDETRSDRLQQSTNLCNVITELQTYYHHVVDKCKTIHKDFTQNCKTPLSPKLVMATADKLIYNHAVHMCQSAALDEFSNNCSPSMKSEVVRRYQVAQILFHNLAQTAHNENDKYILVKYLKNVERRLSVLTLDGIQCERRQSHCVDNQLFQCPT